MTSEGGAERLKGHCPMGCGETLFVASGGYITCSYIECPSPAAVSDLLRDRETEHIVKITESGFSIQHPLRERLKGELFDCGLHESMSEMSGPPMKPGRYRVRLPGEASDDADWKFEDLA